MEMQKFISDVTMPEQYYIAYQVEKEKGLLTEIVQAKDESGNVFFKSGELQKLFVKKKSGYRAYVIEENGLLVSAGTKDYAKSHVDEECKEITDCVRKSIMQRMGKCTLLGERTLVGRSCRDYDVQIKVAVFSQEFLCTVDQETGACLSWKQKTNLNGFVVEPVGNFECTEFITSNVAARMPSQIRQLGVC